MIRPLSISLLSLVAAVSLAASAQQPPNDPSANPGRPTVSTPATLTPVGYLQFESGFLDATHSPEFSSQASFNEVIKLSLARRIELLASTEPFAHSHAEGQSANGTGGVSLGTQVVLHAGEGTRPTIALSYFRQVNGGDAPDLDVGSAQNSALLLVSADVKGFHYDTNYLFNEVIDTGIRRAQFGQTLSVSHPLGRKLGVSGEIWHFTQPFLRGNAVGNLWALNYNLRRNLVLDAGFNRGLTSTSTRWEVFAGFTYLLPHKLLPR
ncbi:MAG: transporter [Acidobacteriia bacterium]|nr:transporter [Terriglobia bacterium]